MAVRQEKIRSLKNSVNIKPPKNLDSRQNIKGYKKIGPVNRHFPAPLAKIQP